MKAGFLSEFFAGVAVKTLSAVEVDSARSNQHEFNGDAGLCSVFGKSSGKQMYDASFIYLNDSDDEPVVDTGFATWYNARESHPVRTEYRLYFPTTSVSLCAAEGDLLVIGRRQDNRLLIIIAQGGSTIANQVEWLFRVSPSGIPGFSIREELETEQDRIQFASRVILEQIGVVVESTEKSYLDVMLQRFEGKFPNTRVFSDYASSTIADIDARQDPDNAIMAWMEREEVLFRTLEKHLLAERLSSGFKQDVDGFLEFSLSVQNRRKSRVGFALENHMERIFKHLGARYTRGASTEHRSKPDFVFPGIKEYRDTSFDPLRLTMLGVKSTCKDRWRQVLAEADRISPKHLLTLETAISTNQTDEMDSKRLQLVVPRSLHETYTPEQQKWLFDVGKFIDLVLKKQILVA